VKYKCGEKNSLPKYRYWYRALSVKWHQSMLLTLYSNVEKFQSDPLVDSFSGFVEV